MSTTENNDTNALAKIPLRELPISYQTLQALHSSPTVPARYQASPTGVNDMYATTIVGAELGVGVFTSIYEIYMVNGQASMSGKMMLALVWRAGHRVMIDIDETSSTVHCYRRWEGQLEKVGEVEFTVEDADRAGLMEKGTYQSYPRTMLTWRAVSMACRLYFPDCILSVGYVPEELGVDAPMDAIPADIIIDGDGLLDTDRAIIELETVLDAVVIDEEQS